MITQLNSEQIQSLKIYRMEFINSMKKIFKDKDELELFQQFEELGYVERICPDCGEESLPTEIDSDNAYCDNCQEYKKYEPVI